MFVSVKREILAAPAKEMVKLVEDIDEIWKILKEAFGDPKVLLNYELDCVRKLGLLCVLAVANAMENFCRTAKTHKIEYELYNSHTERLIYEIMGDMLVDRFLESCAG